MWYHLTQSEDFPDPLTEVRAPEMAYGESKDERLCVASTVSQCILALASLTGLFFILRLDVEDPIPADESVGGRTRSNEHWITQGVIDRHGGAIRVHRAGHIIVDQELRNTIRIAVYHKLGPGWESGETKLFDVQTDGNWLPRFQGFEEIVELLE